MQKIHDAVNVYDDDGFQHLADFQKKMMKKRVKMRNFNEESNKNKKLAKQYNTDTPLNVEKHTFYKTMQKVTKNQEVKNFNILPTDLYDVN